MEQIQAGDVVKLKSGGPSMTVEWVNDESQSASCAWFDSKADQQQQVFALAALTKKE